MQAIVVTVEAGTQEHSAELGVSKRSRKEQQANRQEPSAEEEVSKRPRTATRSDTRAVRSAPLKNSTTRSRMTAAQEKAAARKTRAAAAEAFLKGDVAKQPARTKKYHLVVILTRNIAQLNNMPGDKALAMSDGKFCSTLHFSKPALPAPGQAPLDDNGDKAPPPVTEADVVFLIRGVLPATIPNHRATMHGLPEGRVLQKSDEMPAVKVGWKAGSKLEDLTEFMVFSPKDLFRPCIGGKEFYEPGTYVVGDDVEIYDFDCDEDSDNEEQEQGDASQRPADWWKGQIVGLDGHDAPNTGRAHILFTCDDKSTYKVWCPIDTRMRLGGEEEFFKAFAFVHVTTQRP